MKHHADDIPNDNAAHLPLTAPQFTVSPPETNNEAEQIADLLGATFELTNESPPVQFATPRKPSADG